MRRLLKRLGLAIVALVLIQSAYTAYSIATGDARMRETCAGINPGMSFADLRRYSEDHGLRPPSREVRLMYIPETRSFGRYACKVTLDAGRVTSSEMNFAD